MEGKRQHDKNNKQWAMYSNHYEINNDIPKFCKQPLRIIVNWLLNIDNWHYEDIYQNGR